MFWWMRRLGKFLSVEFLYGCGCGNLCVGNSDGH